MSTSLYAQAKEILLGMGVDEGIIDDAVEKQEFEKRPEYVSLFTHNGLFTVKSLRTGDHRTFRVKTQPADSNFAPGKRVLSYLYGPNNTQDYRGFAFIEDGRILPWRSASAVCKQYVTMLENLDEHERCNRIEVHVSTRCRICNRTLTTPESVKSGIGPICEGRL